MLSSINPLGERTRGQRFWVTVSWYVAGSAVGGITLGGLGGILGSWLPAGNWRLVAVILGKNNNNSPFPTGKIQVLAATLLLYLFRRSGSFKTRTLPWFPTTTKGRLS